jgi:hypothetical protein
MAKNEFVRSVFVYRDVFTNKPVYKFYWKYSDQNMTVYSEPIYSTENLAMGALVEFQCRIVKILAQEILT